MALRYAVEVDFETSGYAEGARRVGTSSSSAAKGVGNLEKGFDGLKRALAAIGFAAFVREIAQAQIQVERIVGSLRQATGSTPGAAAEFAFLRTETDRLGTAFAESAEQYSKLLAAAGNKIPLADVRTLFLGISEAGTALNLSAEQVGGAITAVQQIASRGRVSLEELTGQLAERIPGALGIAARAMNVTEAELVSMVESGKLMAEDLLPALGRELRATFGEEAERGANNFQSAMNRVQNAMFFAKTEVAEGMIPALQETAELLTAIGRSDSARAFFRDLGVAIGESIRLLVRAGSLLEGWGVTWNRVRAFVALFGVVSNQVVATVLRGLALVVDRAAEMVRFVSGLPPALLALSPPLAALAAAGDRVTAPLDSLAGRLRAGGDEAAFWAENFQDVADGLLAAAPPASAFAEVLAEVGDTGADTAEDLEKVAKALGNIREHLEADLSARLNDLIDAELAELGEQHLRQLEEMVTGVADQREEWERVADEVRGLGEAIPVDLVDQLTQELEAADIDPSTWIDWDQLRKSAANEFGAWAGLGQAAMERVVNTLADEMGNFLTGRGISDWRAFADIAATILADQLTKAITASFAAARIASRGGESGFVAFFKNLFGGSGGAAFGALASFGAAVAILERVASNTQARQFDNAAIISGQSIRGVGSAGHELAQQIKETVFALQEAMGVAGAALPTIALEMRNDGEQFLVTMTTLAGRVQRSFRSLEGAVDFAITQGILHSDLSGLSEAMRTALSAVEVISVEHLRSIVATVSQWEQLAGRSEPFLADINRALAESLELARRFSALGLDAGVALRDLADTILEMAQRASDGESFLRSFATARQQLEAEIAALVQRIAELSVETFAGLGEALAEFGRGGIQVTQAMVDTMRAALERQLGLLRAQLAALPDPGELVFGGGGGGGFSQAAADMDRLREILADLAINALPPAQQAMAQFLRQWEGYRELAHGNASLLAQLNTEMERQRELLVQQLVDGFYGPLRDFERAQGSPLADSLSRIRDEADRLREGARDLAEALGFSQERLDRMLGRINQAEMRQLDRLAQEGLAGLLGGLADLVKDEELRHQLLMAQFQIEFTLRMQQFRVEFELLKELGRLTQAQVGLLEDAFAWIEANTDRIFQDFADSLRPPAGAPGPGRLPGGGSVGSNRERESAEALSRLREIRARSLDPFSQAIRGVVDEFAELRRVLGWTAEVQAAYGQEIRRVLTEQLEPIRRMQEELAFRSDSPMRSIDQFRLAQERLNDAVAALRGGDFSQLERIPDLARTVLDLAPGGQATEARRFLFARVQAILDEAQQAALGAALGITPETLTDPFREFRDPVVEAIDRLGALLAGRQSETTTAIRAMHREIALRPMPSPNPSPPPPPGSSPLAPRGAVDMAAWMAETAARDRLRNEHLAQVAAATRKTALLLRSTQITQRVS